MKQKCFEYFASKKKHCNKKTCRYWIDSKEYSNCCIIGANDGDKITLQSIGEMFKVTRMRICQIEKIAVSKLKEKVNSMMWKINYIITSKKEKGIVDPLF